MPLSRQGLNGILKELSRDLEEAGAVPPGTANEVSGISLRAGGVTEAAWLSRMWHGEAAASWPW